MSLGNPTRRAGWESSDAGRWHRTTASRQVGGTFLLRAYPNSKVQGTLQQFEQVSSVSAQMAPLHRPRCRTTEIGVGDFRDISRPFAGPLRSHATATTRRNRLTSANEAAILTPLEDKKPFYIKYLSAGGGRGIRTPDRGLGPYNGLANRRLQPLGHPSAHERPAPRRMRERFIGSPIVNVNRETAGAHAAPLRSCGRVRGSVEGLPQIGRASCRERV